MNSPLVSILMPAYNCEKFVQQAIDCVLSQSYSNFELLIADDCSTDDTKKIIDTYVDHRIKRFHNEKNLGYLKTTNKLFALVKGKYVTFQDADDYSTLDRIEKLVKTLEENEKIGCCYSDVYKIDENNAILGRSNFPKSHADIYKGVVKGVVFCGAAIMIRANVLEKVGYYDEYFHRLGNEDKHWFGNILEATEVLCLDEPMYFYRMNLNSVSRTRTNNKAYVSEDIAKYYILHLRSEKKDLLNDITLKSKLKQYENDRLAIFYMKDASFGKALMIFLKEIFRFRFSNQFFREGLSLLKSLLMNKRSKNNKAVLN